LLKSSYRVLIVGVIVLGATALYLFNWGAQSTAPKDIILSEQDYAPVNGSGLSVESDEEVIGHGDFDDGRKRNTKQAFLEPKSEALHWVNVMLGNGG